MTIPKLRKEPVNRDFLHKYAKNLQTPGLTNATVIPTWTPQLIRWGKDKQGWADMVVYAPPLYIQKKVHPKVLIDDLLRRFEAGRKTDDKQIDLFAGFNGILAGVDKTEFYRHDQNRPNRMFLGTASWLWQALPKGRE